MKKASSQTKSWTSWWRCTELQLFYRVLNCATWEPPIYSWGLDSDPVTDTIILPLNKIWQAIPLLLLPLFTSIAMEGILLGIQNSQEKLCAHKPPARHTLLPRAQHKHYNTDAPGIPKNSSNISTDAQSQVLQEQNLDIVLTIHSKGNRTVKKQTLCSTVQVLFVQCP